MTAEVLGKNTESITWHIYYLELNPKEQYWIAFIINNFLPFRTVQESKIT